MDSLLPLAIDSIIWSFLFAYIIVYSGRFHNQVQSTSLSKADFIQVEKT